jgi:hypothetical protein
VTNVRFNVVLSSGWYFVDRRIFQNRIAFMGSTNRRERFTVYELHIADRGGHIQCHYDPYSIFHRTCFFQYHFVHVLSGIGYLRNI